MASATANTQGPRRSKMIGKEITQWLHEQEQARKSRIRWSPPIFEKHSRMSRKQYLENMNLSMAPQEIDMLAEELEIAEELQEWMVFDLVFGFLVIFNALFIGLEDSYNYEEDATTITSWYIFECLFFVLFSVEWVLRFIGAKSWQKLAEDSWMIIDILLLAITGFDLFIFKFALTEVDGAGNLTIFRAFRIFRLARLVRVFKLLKSVARLVTGLQISFRTLFWAIFLIAVTVFVFAVLMVELVGKNEEAYDAVVRNNWKDLSSSATSFILLATASGWQRRVDALKDANALFLVPILLFMLLVVVGIFNMIIGVMVYTALAIEESARRSGEAQRNFEHRLGLIRLKKILSSVNNRPLLRNPHRMGVVEFAELYDEGAFQKQIQFLKPFLPLNKLRELVHLIAEVNPVTQEYDFSIDSFIHVLSWLSERVFLPRDMVYLRAASSHALEMMGHLKGQTNQAVANFMHKLDACYKEAQEIYPVLQVPDTLSVAPKRPPGKKQSSASSSLVASKAETAQALSVVLDGLEPFISPAKRASSAKRGRMISKQEIEEARTRKRQAKRSQKVKEFLPPVHEQDDFLGEQDSHSQRQGTREASQDRGNNSTLAGDGASSRCTLDFLPEDRAAYPDQIAYPKSGRETLTLWHPFVNAFEPQFAPMEYEHLRLGDNIRILPHLGNTPQADLHGLARWAQCPWNDFPLTLVDQCNEFVDRERQGVMKKQETYHKSTLAEMRRLETVRKPGASSADVQIEQGFLHFGQHRKHIPKEVLDSLNNTGGGFSTSFASFTSSKTLDALTASDTCLGKLKNLFVRICCCGSSEEENARRREQQRQRQQVSPTSKANLFAMVSPRSQGSGTPRSGDRSGEESNEGDHAAAGGADDQAPVADAEDEASLVFFREAVNNALFPVDCFWFAAALLHAILMGLSLSERTNFNTTAHVDSGTSSNDAFRLIEGAFLVIFIGENLLRYLLFIQSEYNNDVIFTLNILPQRQYLCVGLSLFPCEFPYFLRADPYCALDLALISASAFANISLLPLRLPFVQFLRFARHDFPNFDEGWLLLQGMQSAVRTLFWVGVGSAILVYLISIFGMLLLRDQDIVNAQVYFGTLASSSLTVMQIATFDNWSAVVKPMVDAHSQVFIFFAIIITLMNFGLLNIVIGIFCETAYEILEERRKQTDMRRYSQMRGDMGGLRSRLAAYVSLDAEGEVWIDRRLIDKMFESNTNSSSRDGDQSAALQIAGMKSSQVQMILDLLDVDPLDQRGEQSMSEFFTALEAWQRQHVQAIDVFALRVHSETLLRKVRLLEDLVASVSREYERCLPRMHEDLKHAKEKLYPELIRPESGLKGAILKTLTAQRMHRALGETRRKQLLKKAEQDLERSRKEIRESGAVEEELGHVYLANRDLQRRKYEEENAAENDLSCTLAPATNFRFHEWGRRSRACKATKKLSQDFAVAQKKNKKLKQDLQRALYTASLREREIRTSLRSEQRAASQTQKSLQAKSAVRETNGADQTPIDSARSGVFAGLFGS
ncbi:unnamed protein product [Amoebophrya sp. A120]|nr:unnamed protein product [Amoebophrya sp. A120]|eukprot:GSA120T00018696001.1